MSTSSATLNTHIDCPYWRKGYCVADASCKLRHDHSQGGHFQDTYLAQTRNYQTAMMGGGYAINPSQLASAVYGGHMSMGYGYGYYGAVAPTSVPPPPPAQAETSGPPRNYKTVQCRHFLRGHCLRGNACGFRHGEEEPTEDHAASFGQLPAELSNPIHPGRLFRVNTCKRWIQGNCNMGERCTFRHDFEGADMNVQPYSGVKRSLSPDKETAAPTPSGDDMPTSASTPNLTDEQESPIDREAAKLQKT